MEKSISKIASRKNARIGSRKQTRKIQKGVIYVQVSFNNTIMIVIDVRGQVIFGSLMVRVDLRVHEGAPSLLLKLQQQMLFDVSLRTIRRSGILLRFIRM
ncbi:small ribosomal subunit protein uS11c-like [Cicer arietinum]|uniref:small ribosomal subunit protein uS11c-like n=1 Tax=Cicer arietinum TaxID=3827 RepID=UPI003CC50ECF